MVLSKRPIKRLLTKKRLLTSKTGLQMDGISNYVQLPSMTMDSVEIECLIDAVQPNSVNAVIIQNGSSETYARANGTSSANVTILVNGVITINPLPKGTRIKVNLNFPSYTNTTRIMSNLAGANFTKGILYKVTCYLNGSIVAQYDFEKPQNIVGNQVLQNAQNLIPSFEDARWTIHANAKVLGRDVLHLDATAIKQSSYITVDVLPNTQYYFAVNHNANFAIYKTDFATSIVNYTSASNVSFNSGTSTKIVILLSNSSVATGSFDFVRPQLYQLSGKEGTISGAPIQQNKARKRTLYAKR